MKEVTSHIHVQDNNSTKYRQEIERNVIVANKGYPSVTRGLHRLYSLAIVPTTLLKSVSSVNTTLLIIRKLDAKQTRIKKKPKFCKTQTVYDKIKFNRRRFDGKYKTKTELELKKKNKVTFMHSKIFKILC